MTASPHPPPAHEAQSPSLWYALARIPDSFSSVAYSPDGRRIAAGSADGTVKIWDAETGRWLQTLKGHQKAVNSIAYSPDGQRLASGSYDNTIKLWEAKTGRLLQTLAGHQDWVRCVVYSSDGRILASASADKTVKLWDAQSGELLNTLDGYEGIVLSLAFLPASNLLVIGFLTNTILLVDIANNTLLQTLKTDSGSAFSLAVSPDGRWLASGQGASGNLRLWDIPTSQIIHTLEGQKGSINSLMFTNDGSLLASGSNDLTIRLWDMNKPGVSRILESHQDRINGVAFSPDGQTLVSASSDCTLKIWEIGRGAIPRTLQGHGQGIGDVAVCPDGSKLAVGLASGDLYIRDFATGRLLSKLKAHNESITCLKYSPDSIWLASGSGDKSIKLWDVSIGALRHTLNNHKRFINCLSFSSDGSQLASSSFDNTIKIWDTFQGRLIQPIKGLQDWITSIAFSSNNRFVASSSGGKDIKVRNSKNGKLLRTLEGHQYWVNCLSLSPSGEWLASGSQDRTVKIWDVKSWRLKVTLEGHQTDINLLVFSLDSQRLVSADKGGTIKIWDIKRGMESFSQNVNHPGYTLKEIGFTPLPNLPEQWENNLTCFGDPNFLIHTLDAQPVQKLPPRRSYVSAKVVVIGESNVGKSCLAFRLAQQDYQELGTTHGMRTWELLPEHLDPDSAPAEQEDRRVFLWDLGGQHEYRLVHQLFLPETNLALVLFEPTRGQQSVADVREWNARLHKQTQQSGQTTTKLLVGTKLDHGDEVVDRFDIDQLKQACDFVDYWPTSAKTPRGITELGKAILAQIRWEELSKTSRPELFQTIRDAVQTRQQAGEVVLLYKDLEREVFEAVHADSAKSSVGWAGGSLPAHADNARGQTIEPFAHPTVMDDDFRGAVNTVVGQLAGQGQIVDTYLASGERILVLAIGFLSIYAGSLILAARDNPLGIAAVEEGALVTGRLNLPRLPPDERLDPIKERIVLECTLQLLLDRGICFKQQGQLIFPSEFKHMEVGDGERLASTISLSYDFTGAIDNIWVSLVTQLGLAGETPLGFGRIRLWKDYAEFEKPMLGCCGLSKQARKGGLAHVDLIFNADVSQETRDRFIAFVDEHLRREGVEVRDRWRLECPNEHVISEERVRARLSAGKTEITCDECDAVVFIGKTPEQARDAAQQALVALKTKIGETKRREIEESKRQFDPLEVHFVCSRSDERLRNSLINQLIRLRMENMIGMVYGFNIELGEQWPNESAKLLERAKIILLLISSDFIASFNFFELKFERYLERHRSGEALFIPILLRPVDLTGTAIADLQTLPNKPVSEWPSEEAAFQDITQGIRKAIAQFLRPSLAAEASRASEPSFIPTEIQRPPIHILHLSDLHFGPNDDAELRLQPLLTDLSDRKQGFGLEAVDYLVISGDLTQRGEWEEFEKVHEFLSKLVQALKLSGERVLMVPGNHDLSWTEEVYDWMQERRVDIATLKPDSFLKEGNGYLIRNEETYHHRFKNFTRFYHEFKQQEYPLNPAEQGFAYFFHETGLLFVTLNSSSAIDEFFPDRAHIHDKAIISGLNKADTQIRWAKDNQRITDDSSILRIAVCHHPLTGNEKIKDEAFIDHLRQKDFKLCLHGHVHEDRTDLIGYLDPVRKLYSCGAGSFGAVASDRPTSTPRLYNLIEIARDHSRIKVHTRCMRKDNGIWEGWAVWLSDEADQRRTFYEIPLAQPA